MSCYLHPERYQAVPAKFGPRRGYIPLVSITSVAGALGFLVSWGWLTRRARLKREAEEVPKARVV